MTTQTKHQSKQKQLPSKTAVTWSKEKAAALRQAARQRKPSACDCDCNCACNCGK